MSGVSRTAARPAGATAAQHDRRGAEPILVAVVLSAGIVSLLLAAGALPGNSWPAFALSLAALSAAPAAAVALAWRSERKLASRLALWPLGLACVLWAATFVLRPLTLWGTPEYANTALQSIGFGAEDLTRTVGLAGAGIAAWCLAYVAALLPAARRARPLPRTLLALRPHATAWRAVAVLAAGTLLWGALFRRQGGVDALINHPASIRRDQQSSFYGFIGVWMVQGAALYAWIAALGAADRAARRRARWVFAAGFALAVVAAVCLQLRELVLGLGVAMLVTHVQLRRPSARTAAVAAGVLALVAVAVLLFQQVRDYSQRVPTARAVQLTLETPPTELASADLDTFDNLLAMRRLVPSSVAYLDGRTLADVPLALVPRALWRGKPQPIDQLVSGYLDPGGRPLNAQGRALSVTGLPGAPIALQGELYWNLGLAGVAAGSALVGLGMGLVGRLGRRAPESPVLLGLCAVAISFVPLLLTRSLAAMTGNLVLALIGSAIAMLALSRREAP